MPCRWCHDDRTGRETRKRKACSAGLARFAFRGLMSRLFAFWLSHRVELATLLGQHVLLVSGSTLVAVALGVPFGVFAARRPRLAAPLMAVASIVQTVPSLAKFGFLLPVPFIGGLGAPAPPVGPVLHGPLPIVRATIAGLRGIDPSVREAGGAMG